MSLRFIITQFVWTKYFLLFAFFGGLSYSVGHAQEDLDKLRALLQRRSGKEAVPEVIDLLIQNGPVLSSGEFTTGILKSLDGERAVLAYQRALVETLAHSPSADFRNRAGQALMIKDIREIAPKTTFSALYKSIRHDPENRVRISLAFRLSDLHNLRLDFLDGDELVGVFLSLLDDGDPEIRRCGAICFERMGPDAVPGPYSR